MKLCNIVFSFLPTLKVTYRYYHHLMYTLLGKQTFLLFASMYNPNQNMMDHNNSLLKTYVWMHYSV